MFDLGARYMGLKPEILRAVEDVLDSGVYIGGPHTAAFEAQMATFLQAKHVIATANGNELGIANCDSSVKTGLTLRPVS